MIVTLLISNKYIPSRLQSFRTCTIHYVEVLGKDLLLFGKTSVMDLYLEFWDWFGSCEVWGQVVVGGKIGLYVGSYFFGV